MFYNYTNEDFHITWDSFPYLFKAGEIYDGVAISEDKVHSVTLNDVVSEIFARHLANKVMDTPSLNMNFRKNSEGHIVPNDSEQRMTYNVTNMEILVKRGITPPSVDVSIPVSVGALPLMAGESPVTLEQPVEASEAPLVEVPKKRGRPKKVESASPSPDAEFAL